jgi:hypothetical protein
MAFEDIQAIEGGCSCRKVRYRMAAPPMFVHCCHCRWCQRETGSAFVLNAIVEADQIELLSGRVEVIDTPSESGRGQKIHRCPICRIALWSNYAGAGDSICFVRVGTLDEPDRVPPDIHIFTSSKQPWLTLPADVPAVPGFYRFKDQWPAESIDRYRAAQVKLKR